MKKEHSMHAITQNNRMERMSDYLRGEAARSLALLRDIDGTIEVLVLVRRQMDVCHEAVDSLIKRVHDEQQVHFTEDEIIPALEQSQDLLQGLHDDFAQRLSAARNAPDLYRDDRLDEAYTQAVSAVTCYNDAIERLKWSILEHNADMQGKQKSQVLRTEKDIDDLFDSL